MNGYSGDGIVLDDIDRSIEEIDRAIAPRICAMAEPMRHASRLSLKLGKQFYIFKCRVSFLLTLVAGLQVLNMKIDGEGILELLKMFFAK